MGEPLRLLAKSCDDERNTPRGALLQGHTAEVLSASRMLLDRRGVASLNAVRLSADQLPRLRRLVLAAALLHDLGKCSDHFQRMLRDGSRQLARHEALSAFLAWSEPLRTWLAPLGNDLPLAIVAAAGHHRKFDSKAWTSGDDAPGTSLRLLAGHADFAHTLRLSSKELGLSDAPRMVDVDLRIAERRNVLIPVFADLQVALDTVLAADPDARALVAVTKALVLAADVAGSALPVVGERPSWLGDVFGSARGDLSVIAAHRLKGKSPFRFQENVAACSAPLALISAGCGSGKTAAAYLWAARNHPQRQLWVCYPTTGTATAGFCDYLRDPEDPLPVPLQARLAHSRASVDLDILGLNDDADGQRDADRLAALRAWGDDVVACTCDTVLGLMQNQRQGLYHWPGVCAGAVVFDEVHAYDDRLFGCLLAFLRRLPGIPVLMMTASLPMARLEALRALCLSVHGRFLPEIPGPDDLETVSRYHRVQGDTWERILSTITGGGKVLWVRNTVDRCLSAGAEAIQRGLSPLLYHSRFRYVDRVERHRDVIEAFKRSGPAIAITTQVAEMSLDLSADLLVSDLAPVPALIQRLGRLNRRVDPQHPGPTKPFLIESFSGKPYDDPKDTLIHAQTWLDVLGDGGLSQRRLAEAWSHSGGMVRETASAWWDGGYVTEPDTVRDANPGIAVLLKKDQAAVKAKPSDVVRYAIPMNPPRGHVWQQWKREAHLPVADDTVISYDPMKGATWLP